MRVVLGNPLDAGVKLKKERYIFGASSVTYLSHRTDAKGLHPLHDKVKAIVDGSAIIRRPMDLVRLGASNVQSQSELSAPTTEEHDCDVPLNVSALESAIGSIPAPDTAEQTYDIPEVKMSEIVPSRTSGQGFTVRGPREDNMI
ncbi:hypothetical protein LSH36_135g01004 [Paralvinella palmiformis]|uniref:Uncharacterized protein n=1 Tax=Paralvinella palmiformis TaxID=53620 RepID=A0AAD9JW71_9ANNE|nr:hypothetical protein LSH36_135g01004 [Paralvinella palmiformis]